jgi:hypothetical protein
VRTVGGGRPGQTSLPRLCGNTQNYEALKILKT